MMGMEIGIVLLTLNAKNDLPFCLPPLLEHKVLVVDSSSTDGTERIASKMGASVLSIPRRSFHHGRTREQARKILGTDIVVMVTQDAYAERSSTVKTLVGPIIKGEASLSYARQLPKSQDPFEALPRLFNYPKESHLRSLEDAKEFGSYLYFFSNSFGAYLNSALDEIGGFPEVAFGEDTHACARLINRGHRVAYVAESLVFHSHRLTAAQEFRRYFEIGSTREGVPTYGQDEARGRAFAKFFLKSLRYGDIPKGVVHLSAKYAGYQLGKAANFIGYKKGLL